MQNADIDGGFVAPVFDSQSVFRAVMDAMAQPGTVQAVNVATQPPAPLSPVAAAVALTLCDHDAKLWLDAPLRSAGAVAPWLGFHTGAPLVTDESEAQFALVADAAALPPLAQFAQGTQTYPDRSATLIVQVAAFIGGPKLVLEGPGIETRAQIAPSGLPDDFCAAWRGNNALFPRGVDLILTAPEGIVCLPRTTRISLLED